MLFDGFLVLILNWVSLKGKCFVVFASSGGFGSFLSVGLCNFSAVFRRYIREETTLTL
jgi:hypothetical protein